MPVHTGKDKDGTFYRWGTSGKKFYFDPESEQSRGIAKSKAQKQAQAIYASGYKGDSKMSKVIKVKVKLYKVKIGDSATTDGILKRISN